MESPTSTEAVVAADRQSYVDWSAVFAGAVAALAVSFVLLTFGAAIGLSAVSPWTSGRGTVTAIGIGSGFWILLVTVWSFALGGYLAARLRHRSGTGTVSEMNFRDNAHGMLAWALAVSLAALTAALATTPGPSPAVNPATATAVDTLVRSPRTNVPPADESMRSLVSRILVANVGKDRLDQPDQTFLAELVAARTGVSGDEAQRRVSTAFTEFKQSADRARKAGIVMGFLAAATLLLGGVTAWWAASVGGRHREEGTLWSGFERRALITPTTPGGLR